METDITGKIKPLIRYSLPVLIIIAALCIAGIFFWHQHKSVLTINDAKLTSSVVHVSAQTDGTLTEILVNDGDKVEAGQVIARVKVKVTPEQIQALQQAYDEAQSNFDKVESEVKSSVQTQTVVSSAPAVRSGGDVAGAQARLDAAAAQKTKMEKLYSIGAVSASQYAEAESEYAAAQSALSAASAPVSVPQQQVQTQSSAPSAELSQALANAQIQLNQAKAALDQAQSDNNYADITAPVAGIIYTTDFQKGDEIKQGDVFLNVGNTKNLWVQAPLTEQQYNEVRPGQFVRYSVDGMSLTGTVLEVTHEGGEEAGEQLTTAARISFPDDMIDQVVPGADVQAEITLDR